MTKDYRWKVVTKDRKSAVVHYMPQLVRSYEVGKEVKAVEGTCGIMTFRSRESAEYFMRDSMVSNGMIIKVKPVGGIEEVKILRHLSSHCGLEDMLKRIEEFGSNFFAPIGTECYKSVIVLT